MEKKYVNLLGMGAVLFIVVLGVFIVFLPGGTVSPVTTGNTAIIEPYYVTQFLEQNPEFEKGIFDFMDLKTVQSEKVALDEAGFATGILVLGEGTSFSEGSVEIATILVSNDSSKLRNIVILSKDLDGLDKIIKEIPLTAGDAVSLNVFIGSFLETITQNEHVNVEKTEHGVPLFAIGCNLNCDESSSFVSVYYS